MGWLKSEREDEPRLIPVLWDEIRDSIGNAVFEYNEDPVSRMSDASKEHAAAKDCTSQGRYCRRVTKFFGGVAIEIFLDQSTKTLKTCRGAIESEITICRYRVSEDRKRAELFIDNGEQKVISIEDACRLALRDFLINPVGT